ncbi:MAG: hypothetical protein WCV69_04890 [Patescibacteria group bacterium]|jgi:hypothetical protein
MRTGGKIFLGVLVAIIASAVFENQMRQRITPPATAEQQVTEATRMQVFLSAERGDLIYDPSSEILPKHCATAIVNFVEGNEMQVKMVQTWGGIWYEKLDNLSRTKDVQLLKHGTEEWCRHLEQIYTATAVSK